MTWTMLPWISLATLLLAVGLLVFRVMTLHSNSKLAGFVYLVVAGLIAVSLSVGAVIAYRRMLSNPVEEDSR